MARSWRARGLATWRISLSAVGGMKALRTPCRAISAKARSGSNLAMRCASTGTPKCQAGNSASISPPIHAQSAGVHIKSPGCGKKLCGSEMPGRWPSSTRWACSAPLGGPVVPEV